MIVYYVYNYLVLYSYNYVTNKRTNVLEKCWWLSVDCKNVNTKLLSLTYKILTTNQPKYLHNLISVQPCHNTRSSSMVTLARPPTLSSLKITNHSFPYAAPCLWNELPTDLRHGEPRQIHFLSLSPITHGSLSSSSSPSSLSPLASSLTRSVFHSELKTWLPDWFYGHSDQLMFLFCSTAGSVCMVSLVC